MRKGTAVHLLLAFTVLAGATESRAWTDVPVCLAPGAFRRLAAITDGAGGAFITWDDTRADPANPNTVGDIYAQRISAAGVAQWTTDGLPICTTSGVQGSPAIVSDAVGGAIIFWNDYGANSAASLGVFAQRVSGTGHLFWPASGVRLDHGAGVRAHAFVADGAGGAFAAWDDAGQIFVQHVDGSGTTWAADRAILSTSSACSHYGDEYGVIGLVSDGAGGCVVAWAESCKTISSFNGGLDSMVVYAQRLDITGLAEWPAGGVRVDAFYGIPGSITALGGAQTVLAWDDLRHFGGPSIATDIYAQKLSSAGVPQWVAGGKPIWTAPDTSSTQAFSLSPDGSGGVFAAWDDAPFFSDDPGRTIRAQHLNATGDRQWADDGVGLATGSVRRDHAIIVPDGSGGIVVPWNDNRNSIGVGRDNQDLFAQRLSVGGTEQWTGGGVPVTTMPSTQSLSAAVTDDAGGAIVAYLSSESGAWHVYAARLENDGTPAEVSLVSASATSHEVTLRWFSAEALAAEVWRASAEGQWRQIGHVAADGTGQLIFRDRTVAAGQRYGYRLLLHDADGQHVAGETWISVEATANFGLQVRGPNPAQDRVLIEYSLASTQPAVLELLDVAGRVVLDRVLRSGDIGATVMSVSRLPAGTYLLRLRQGDRRAVKRLAIVR